MDAFLDLALQYERENIPSLHGFLVWLSQQDIIIKRDMDQTNLNAVRIMTVHGSKGLQGNIVFLPDTRSYSVNNKSKDLMWIEGLPFWIANKKETPNLFKNYFEKQAELALEERHRLLYDALTRASDRLYVCGYNGKRSAPEDNWYDLIKESIGEEEILKPITFTSLQTKEVKQKLKRNFPNDFEEIPEWAIKTPEKVKEKPLPLSPSKMGEEEVEEKGNHLDRVIALNRGSFIHEMLQILPTISKEKRKEVLDKCKPTDIEIPENLLEIFEKFSEVFSDHSVAEVPIIGTIDGQPISGQIDRLIIKENEVMIVDFKTNRFVPEKIPDNYQKQLKAYRDLIKNIFPDKIVKYYLLCTENMTLMEVK